MDRKQLNEQIKKQEKEVRKQEKLLNELRNEKVIEVSAFKIKNLLKQKKYDEAIKVIQELKKQG